MKRYKFELTGITPLIMHADDINGADELKAWRSDPKHKNLSVPGDDRSPPWTWQTYLYRNDTHVCIPPDNIMRALMKAGTQFKLRGQTTFKALTQSGLIIEGQDGCDFFVGGKQIALSTLPDRSAPFAEHVKAVRKQGYALHVKRAKVNTAKHIRVRPIFDGWSVRGVARVVAPEITEEIFGQLLQLAGRVAGLCDWRPDAPKSPGPFGQFDVTVKKI